MYTFGMGLVMSPIGIALWRNKAGNGGLAIGVYGGVVEMRYSWRGPYGFAYWP